MHPRRSLSPTNLSPPLRSCEALGKQETEPFKRNVYRVFAPRVVRPCLSIPLRKLHSPRFTGDFYIPLLQGASNFPAPPHPRRNPPSIPRPPPLVSLPHYLVFKIYAGVVSRALEAGRRPDGAPVVEQGLTTTF